MLWITTIRLYRQLSLSCVPCLLYTSSDFTEILAHVKEQFAAELVEEKIARNMNSYVRLEKNPVIRAVPLEIKKYFLMLGANLSSRSITAVYSNIGILRFPKEYNQYIDRFGIFASTNSCLLYTSKAYEAIFVTDEEE